MADDSGNTLVKPEDVISQAAKELDSENGSNIERIELAGELEQPGAPISLEWGGLSLPVGRITQAEAPTRFGFVGQPA